MVLHHQLIFGGEKISMNNRLKFRVWDSVSNRFYSQNILNRLPLDVFLASENVQQYTGLNDIDGKDIYEGDLVELHTASNDKAAELEDRSHYGLYEVYFDRCYRLREIKPNWVFKVTDNDLHNFNICKVVGNIFENPELIKNENS